MTVAPALQTYLEQKRIDYDLIGHKRTRSSLSTAEACHVAGDCVVKGVVLRVSEGYVLAILPASYRIRLTDLKTQFGEDCDFASELELAQLFPDCALGAVPAVGECYGLDLVVEDSIHEQAEIYFEGGDHMTLVHMSQAQFAQLIGDAAYAGFCGRDRDG